ncbi:hypothetical protein H9L21_01060 [Aeromicrobium senzhongii]|uniref:Uncharacterized protein n=1 Tax=Aeromicrobium senzhongii TaxID=2663859 RepID=A0ABX6ST59_9ACTN|nr:hypothetical protein [Aeromicrobium senzhongii]MTB88438.1 hypothetical protein [Aeromicrobium senzhongii]QNL94598.1 hypothetical protein H9L21_01060 [Aeromicrobium senzhongii]
MTVGLVSWGTPAIGADPATSREVTHVSAPLTGKSTLDALPDSAPIAVGARSSSTLSAPSTADGEINAPTPTGGSVGIGLPLSNASIADTTQAGSAIYLDARDEVDLTVQAVDVADLKAIESAVRAIITIHDAQAPTTYAFPLDLPRGAKIAKQADGGVQVRNATGGVIGIVTTPWAVDASGRELPTRFEVRGSKLIQHVDHGGAKYPVLADPVWFVPVAVIGSRVAVKVAVKALTKKGAKRAAKKIAKRHGHRVKSVGAPIKGSFRTAGNFKITLGQIPTRGNGFKTFAAFKKKYGGAGKNREWHHIVEQSTLKRKNKAIRPKRWEVHNRMNIVSIPKGIHQKCISALMGTKLKNIPAWQLKRLGLPLTKKSANLTLRGSLAGYSYRNMHLLGLRLLDLCGVDVVGDGI